MEQTEKLKEKRTKNKLRSMISLVRSRDCERSVTNDANSCKAAHCTALRHNDRLARTSSASHTHLTSIKCWSGRLEISWCWYCDENVVVLLALKVFVEMWLLKRVHQRRRQSTGTRGAWAVFGGHMASAWNASL